MCFPKSKYICYSGFLSFDALPSSPQWTGWTHLAPNFSLMSRVANNLMSHTTALQHSIVPSPP